MILPGITLTRGGTFEVWACWVIDWSNGGDCEGGNPFRSVPDLHYRRDRIGD